MLRASFGGYFSAGELGVSEQRNAEQIADSRLSR